MENDKKSKYKENVYSNVVPAGKKRTYFFDVRETKGNDYFITLTESTRRQDGSGYNRHKLFLYKEDFNKFIENLEDTINYVKKNLMPDFDYDQFANDGYYEDGKEADSPAEGTESNVSSDSEKVDDTDFDIGEELSW